MRSCPLAVCLIAAAWVISDLPISAEQTAPSGKPPHRQVQTTCEHCVTQERDVNAAYDALDIWWNRKLALQASIAGIERQIGERESLIRSLELVPPSSRSAQQQQFIDAHKQINAAEQARLARARRELKDAENEITEWTSFINEVLAKLARCEREKCKTSPPTPPVNTTGGPTPSGTGQTALAAACERCKPLADRIRELEKEKAELDQRWGNMVDLLRPADGYVGFPAIYARLRTIDGEIEAAWTAYWRCVSACLSGTPIYTRPYVYGPVIGVGVIGGVLSKGSPRLTPPIAAPEQPSPPIGATPNPAPQPSAPTPAPTPTPPPGQSSCSGFSGTSSFTGTIRLPRSCFVAGSVPFFQSPISGTIVIQLTDGCTVTVTTRHPNGWTFAHDVGGTIESSRLTLRSVRSFSSTQPFNAPFSSTIEIIMTPGAIAGTETHTGNACADVYDVSGNR